ncbi:MAG: cadherin-like domain-containing protein, partial [Pirellulaceae bacterium]
YALLDDAAGRFAIDPTTGLVTVAAAAALDFESNSSHVIVVEAASSDGSTALASFTILVSDVNEVPSGTQDWYTTSFIDELRISSAGLLLNDSDVDGDPLTAVLSTNPTVGTLVFQEDGSFLYVPLPNFVGDVTFVYRVSDGEFFSEAITVTISVEMPRNVPSPSSGSDTGSIAQDRTGDNADKSEGKTTEASLLVTDGELETTNNASGMAATPVADESDSSL